MSKRLGVNKGCKNKNYLIIGGLNWVPQWYIVAPGQQCNIEEKPAVILYTYYITAVLVHPTEAKVHAEQKYNSVIFYFVWHRVPVLLGNIG